MLNFVFSGFANLCFFTPSRHICGGFQIYFGMLERIKVKRNTDSNLGRLRRWLLFGVADKRKCTQFLNSTMYCMYAIIDKLSKDENTSLEQRLFISSKYSL